MRLGFVGLIGCAGNLLVAYGMLDSCVCLTLLVFGLGWWFSFG